ncbi:MAG TPA: UDP-glucose 4-epimerase GalE [Actinomycetota bacterium]
MRWVVTGGAGYIGAHVVRALLAAGEEAVVVDDLSTGLPERVPEGVPLHRGTVRDAGFVRKVFAAERADGVVHLAAKKSAPESVERPAFYYHENVDGMLAVLDAMVDEGLDKIVLSSSAAVYGTSDAGAVTEDAPTRPESPYGQTKLASEWMVQSYAAVTGMSWVSLRYFNVVGAGAGDLGDTSEFNLVPLVFRALAEGRRPKVYGDDYPTRDGTCIRDYVDVVDLADAHALAARRIAEGPQAATFNIGTGRGSTVLEVVETVRDVTGLRFDHEVTGRRPGDPASIVADTAKIEREWGWRARRDLRAMIEGSWRAWQQRQAKEESR